MTQIAIRNHIISQFLLKKWGDDKKQIYVFQKDEVDHKIKISFLGQRGAKGLAYKENWLSPNVENICGRLESQVAPISVDIVDENSNHRLFKNPNSKKSKNQKRILSDFAILSWIRGIGFDEEFQSKYSFSNKMDSFEFRNFIIQREPFYRIRNTNISTALKFCINPKSDLYKKKIFDYYSQKLSNNNELILGITNESMSFLLSDNFLGGKCQTFFRNMFTKQTMPIEQFIPLSPTSILLYIPKNDWYKSLIKEHWMKLSAVQVEAINYTIIHLAGSRFFSKFPLKADYLNDLTENYKPNLN